MDVIFLQAIRSSFDIGHKGKPGWVGALLDPAIGKAIVTIHTGLDAAMSVDALAREIGMSRSAFSARFAQLLGGPPMTYVTRWRMNRAAHHG
jgi:transcriptional regulator GlxA family with amidase domain